MVSGTGQPETTFGGLVSDRSQVKVGQSGDYSSMGCAYDTCGFILIDSDQKE